MKRLDKLPFFFVVGRPRSGTTLLRSLFDAHPNVQIPIECKFILDLYPKYGRKTHWSHKDILEFFDDLLKQLRFDTWTISHEKLRRDLLKCAGDSPYSRICKVVYYNYQSFFPKDKMLIFGDKNPGYTIYTERLLEIFPGSKFIHIVRDYRDNYVSVKDVDFELPIPSMVAYKWRLFYRSFERFRKQYPDLCRVIRYEDLTADPERETRELCRFLGLDYYPEVLNYYKKKDEILKVYPKEFITRYHANLGNQVNQSRVEIWKRKLTRMEIILADIGAGKTSEKAGYRRQYRGANPLFHLMAWPGIFIAITLAVLTRIVDTFPYKARMAILNRGPLVVTKTFLRIFNPKKYREIRDRMK
jgi:hypothetical protein